MYHCGRIVLISSSDIYFWLFFYNDFLQEEYLLIR